MSKNLVLSSLVEEKSEELAKETIKFLIEVSKPKSIAKDLLLKFLKYYIKITILDNLNEYKVKKISDAKAYDYTKAVFLEFKVNLQREISTAFEDAFKTYSNKEDVEYYCVINPVPDPISKELN